MKLLRKLFYKTITPNTRYDILRGLYGRIAAKPQELTDLSFWRSDRVDCGTPHCVLGELFSMPELQAAGFHLKQARDVHNNGSYAPRPFLGSNQIYPLGSFPSSLCRPLEKFLGITHAEGYFLFSGRTLSDGFGTDRDVALRRIERVLRARGETVSVELEELLPVLSPGSLKNVYNEERV